ncbi:MAG: Cysteine desulfurase [Parcubacteria group bacterium GW2011_GWA2_43_17]|nr:MAG: Cysteine desulfurase [Parcubacteria group bacterium GW2011_GWA2_43_17]KKT94125.1 MAG: Cysteine desulfurase [Parcubacteria group bacterium GW2011_GWF2_45_11]HAH04405.1 cysteine desulfurase NifS [Candidatus Komeilibacteria bacterium]HBR13432.1 cysteine desulfurase NifS [Candidatus Komeilibacteria bacterium]HCC73254.1 cysteine desulfurase NifS [Candidatus Komeilibacteria bacterium]
MFKKEKIKLGPKIRPDRQKVRYFDHAATTYLAPRVVKAMEPYWSEKFGNPSALYAKGREAKAAIDQARAQVAQIFNCSPGEIIFEGSGTESDNHALIGTALANKARGNHIITSTIEHHAVLHALGFLETQGFEVTYLPVDRDGLIKLAELEKAIRPETILVSIMLANNEIGTVQPIKEISAVIKSAGQPIMFHTDACQAAGFYELDVASLGVDLMTVNGSKIYGPKGTGVLYVKKGTAIQPYIHGGGQENGRRAGTENVAGIVGLATALELVQAEKEQENERLLKLRSKLIDGLLKIPKVVLNGHPEKRLPNNVNVTIKDIEGEAMLLHLDEYGIAASTGSACTSGSLEPSHVILALGHPYEMAHGSIRFSLGHSNTAADIDFLLKVFPPIIEKLRAMSPVKLGE